MLPTVTPLSSFDHFEELWRSLALDHIVGDLAHLGEALFRWKAYVAQIPLADHLNCINSRSPMRRVCASDNHPSSWRSMPPLSWRHELDHRLRVTLSCSFPYFTHKSGWENPQRVVGLESALEKYWPPTFRGCRTLKRGPLQQTCVA